MRIPPVRAVIAAALFLAAAAPAAAQATLPGLDPGRLATGADSLAVYLIRGVDTVRTGLVVDALSTREEGGRTVLQRVYETRDMVLGARLDTIADDHATLAPVRYRGRTDRGIELLDFTNGRATGVLYMADGDSVVVDAAVPTGTFNSSSFDLALRAAPLAEGWAAEIPAFLPNTRTVVRLAARAVGVETLDGVRCWRVDAEFTGMPVTFWIADEGRRLCRQTMRLRHDTEVLFAPLPVARPTRRST